MLGNIDFALRDYIRRKLILGDRYGWLKFYPRHKERYVNFKKRKIKIIDSHSFVFMYQEIFVYQIYKFLPSRSNPYIIDGGANIGLASAYFSYLFPDAKILAFEPDPDIFTVFKENIQSLGLHNVSPIEKGIWDENTILKFLPDGSDGGKIIDSTDHRKHKEVSVCTLRPYLQQPVDFLKLDIEGAEYKVLCDIEDLLPNVENIFVEYHSFIGKKQVLKDILDILQKAGFRFYLAPAGAKNDQPFISLWSNNGMDNQINIFGYRE